VSPTLTYTLPSAIHATLLVHDINADGIDEVIAVDVSGDVWSLPTEQHQSLLTSGSSGASGAQASSSSSSASSSSSRVKSSPLHMAKVGNVVSMTTASPPPLPLVHVYSQPTLYQASPKSSPTLLVSYTDLLSSATTFLAYDFHAGTAVHASLPAVSYTPTAVYKDSYYLATTDGEVLHYSTALDLLHSFSTKPPFAILDPLVIVSDRIFLVSSNTLTSLAASDLTKVYERVFDDAITSPLTPLEHNNVESLAFTITDEDLCVHLHIISASTGVTAKSYPMQLTCGHAAGIVPRLVVLQASEYGWEGGIGGMSPTSSKSLRIGKTAGDSSSHDPFSGVSPTTASPPSSLLLVPLANELITVTLADQCVAKTHLSSPSLSHVILKSYNSGDVTATVFTREDVVTYAVAGNYRTPRSGYDDVNVWAKGLTVSANIVNAMDSLDSSDESHTEVIARVVGRRIGLGVTVHGGGNDELTMTVTDGTGSKGVLYEGAVGRGHNLIKLTPLPYPRVMTLFITVSGGDGVVATRDLEIYYNVDLGGLVEGVIVASIAILVFAVGYKAFGGEEEE
jgi:hypothetical protein